MNIIGKIKRKIHHTLVNSKSWRTDRKIVVFESDDWGSVRMSSKENYNRLLAGGLRVDNDPYCKYDALETEDDLSLLFDVLIKHKDKCQNPAIFTANSLVANPDFEKIKNDGFRNYYLEEVTETFKKYPNHANCFNLWKEGRENKVFHNQSHGREHLNTGRWMKALQQNSKETIEAFNMGIFGISTTISTEKRASYMAAFDADSDQQIEDQKHIITDGLQRFEKLFGYASKSFIAPNYTWSPKLESSLKQGGVLYLQGSKVQKIPNTGGGSINTRVHYNGENNSLGQKYLVRNVSFEPSLNENNNWVNSCLAQIEQSFKSRRPAIITSHRLNFTSLLDEGNRDRNLKMLDSLLTEITKKWPAVEFMTSDQLGNIMTK